MKFLHLLIDRSRTTMCALVLLLILGSYAYTHMPVEATPNINTPYVSILVALDGVSPEDGVRLLIKPSEGELRNIDGVKEVTARALENFVNIVIEFNSDVVVEDALSDVRAAMGRARADFPVAAKEPIIKEITTDQFPVIAIGIIGDGVQERVLNNIAQSLKRKIQVLPNILTADVVGARQELLEIVIDNSQLQSYGVNSAELMRAVSMNNMLVPAGNIDTGRGRFAVKLPGLIEDYEDLYSLPLKSTSEGVVRLGDVADIRRTFKDAEGLTRVNGHPAISIEISKRSGSNMIEVATSVRNLIDSERKNMPKGIQLVSVFDHSQFALQMVKELEGNILAALVLVLVVVVAALGLRTSLLVSMGVPFATLGGITVLYFLGFSFNFMVLFGLLLALGMIVDGAIVIAEYADCKMAEGLSPRDAYIAASKRMFAPATASVLTTLVAFLPMMFWPGVDGQFMRILPITVFAILSFSLLFALVFLPVLGSLFGKPHLNAEEMAYIEKLENGDPRLLDGLTGIYARFIERVLSSPLISLFSVVFILVAIFMLYGKFNAGTQYFTETEGVHGEVNVSTRGNLSFKEAAALVEEVEAIVRKNPYVTSTYTSAYPVGTATNRRNSSEDEIGHILVEITPSSEREKTSDQVFWDIRESTKHLSGVRIYADTLKSGPPIASDIHMQFYSDNQELLQSETLRVRNYLETKIKDIVDVDDTLPLPGLEWELEVDRSQAALYGASIADVGLAVQLLTSGVLVGKYRPDDAAEELEIRMRYPVNQRNIKALDVLTVNTAKGTIPISNFVTRVAKPHVNKLQRLGGTGVASVYANAAIGVLPNDKIAEIKKWLENDANIDARVKAEFVGATANQEKTIQFLSLAFTLGMILMMALMVAQFNSFYQTFLVLSSVVMSTAGVLLGHMIFQQSFSIILGGVGLVALAGVIVHNNIILLDTYNHLRRNHPELPLIELAVRTGAQRLRPVFLTVITAGLGLVPLALGVSVDLIERSVTDRGQVAGYWKPLAASLVYGLTFATMLTLIITPMLMILPERFKRWREGRK